MSVGVMEDYKLRGDFRWQHRYKKKRRKKEKKRSYAAFHRTPQCYGARTRGRPGDNMRGSAHDTE
jgi:hypothetical protein